MAVETVIHNGAKITRFEQFLRGSPNEIGDTLAGFVGSLTLIWVVASVIQQGLELRAQRKEFSEMVAAQEQQARQLGKQVEILDFQLKSLIQRDARSHLDQIVKKILRSLEELGGLAHWEHHSFGTSVDVQTGKTTTFPHVTKCGILQMNAHQMEERLSQAVLSLKDSITRMRPNGDIKPRNGKKSAARDQVVKVIESINSAIALEVELGSTDAQWLKDLELLALRSALIDLSEMDLWDPQGHDGYTVQS